MSVNMRFDEDKSHVWIDGRQYVSLERFLAVKNELNKEQSLLMQQVDDLLAENAAYKVLLKDVLTKEEEDKEEETGDKKSW